VREKKKLHKDVFEEDNSLVTGGGLLRENPTVHFYCWPVLTKVLFDACARGSACVRCNDE